MAQASQEKMQYSTSKTIKAKRAGGRAQVVESLPSKHKALSSIPSIITTKKKKKQKTELRSKYTTILF
jgi:hypothetical protein